MVTGVTNPSEASMIVCSCNVLSDQQVRAVLNGAECPRRPAEIYGCLGCSPQCGRCARTLRRIMDETIASGDAAN
jgi:bacterioferritin-associated ferredoxin